MNNYILKRLLLIIPTLLGIFTINFFLIQAAPGGPVDTMIARLTGEEVSIEDRAMGQDTSADNLELSSETNDLTTKYEGGAELSPELILEIEKLYGFDKPIMERFFLTLKNYLFFDFGDSFFVDKSVMEMIVERLPVSISLGVWSTFFIYVLSIPIGIRKAIKHGSKFDVWTSFFIILGSAIPVFLFAVILVIFFAGGNYFAWFPMRGLTSEGFENMSFFAKLADYAWHLFLPILSMVIGGFAGLTMLTKNSFLDELHKQYVITARAKGVTEKRVLYGHVFRNAMLIVISGLPATFINMFFTGSLLIEVIFSLNGMGLMGFEAALKRDYPVMFSTLYIFTLLGLLLNLISDITYTLVDPRISFKSAERG